MHSLLEWCHHGLLYWEALAGSGVTTFCEDGVDRCVGLLVCVYCCVIVYCTLRLCIVFLSLRKKNDLLREQPVVCLTALESWTFESDLLDGCGET